MKIIIQGQVAPKKNSRNIVYNPRTKRRFVVSSATYQQWHKDALWQLKGIPAVETYPVSVTMTFYFKDQRRRDLDNGVASVMDLLQDSHIIEDDDWQHIGELHVYSGGVDKLQPRVEVDISPVLV